MDRLKLLGVVGLVGILVVLSLFWIWEDGGLEGECVRVETGCCSCANGGEEICVLKDEAERIEDAKNCDVDVFCAAVYSCEIEYCEYVEGECVAR